MSYAPAGEQQAFRAAHPDLYEIKDGHTARLKAANGKIALGSLNVPGSRSAPRWTEVDADHASNGMNPRPALQSSSELDSVEAVEEFMTAPSAELVARLKATPGDIMILASAARWAPTLARLATRGGRPSA